MVRCSDVTATGRLDDDTAHCGLSKLPLLSPLPLPVPGVRSNDADLTLSPFLHHKIKTNPSVHQRHYGRARGLGQWGWGWDSRNPVHSGVYVERETRTHHNVPPTPPALEKGAYF